MNWQFLRAEFDVKFRAALSLSEGAGENVWVVVHAF